MTALLSKGHRLYKRHQLFLESALTATGLAALVAVVLVTIPVYPTNWAPVLVAVTWFLALRWPWSAYMVALLAVLYPIYSISLYLMILFVAVGILAHRPFSHYLGATVLVLSVPFLAEYHLHWLVPILAGLWWGMTSGLWIGVLAAVWGKLIGGMSGINPDWLNLAGQAPIGAGLVQRFNDLSALETLSRLMEPFIVNATVLLYHLLQIGLWGAVALLMGFLVTQRWFYKRLPWSSMVAVTLGILALGAGHITLAMWLTDVGVILNTDSLILTAVVTLFTVTTLEVTRQYLDLPVLPLALGRSRGWLSGLRLRGPRKVKVVRKPKPEPAFAVAEMGQNQARQQAYRPSPANQTKRNNGLGSPKIVRAGETVARASAATHLAKEDKEDGNSSAPSEKSAETRQNKAIPMQNLPEWKPPENDSGLILLELD